MAELAMVESVGGFDLAYEAGRMSKDAGPVFTLWLGLPDRSMKVAADHSGKSYDLVRKWSAQYQWPTLANRYDQGQANALLGALRAGIVRHAFAAVQVGISMMQDETVKPGDRLKAATWIASLGGLGPRSAPAIPDADNGVGLVNADDLRRLATSGDPEDLKRLVRLTTGGGE